MNNDYPLSQVVAAQLNLVECKTLEDVYETTIKECCNISGAKTGSLYKPVFNNGEFKYKNICSTSGSAFGFLPDKGGYVDLAYTQNKPYVIEAKEAALVRPEFLHNEVTYIIFIPLFHNKISQGVLSLRYFKKARPNKEILNNLMLFGSFVSVHLSNIMLITEKDAALKTRDLFIDFAAHELRSPLTAAVNFTQLVKKNIVDNKIPNITIVDAINDQLKQLKDLINQFLDINSITNNALTYELKPQNLYKLLLKITIVFKSLYPSRILNYSLSLDKNLMVTIDESKFIQVIINLLNNATKYSHKSKPITLQALETAKSVAIIIQDEGVGISPEEQLQIFDRFYRTEKAKNKGGLGLGLYLVKQILDAHNASISIVSKPNIGTSFTISIKKLP